ncbi:MAG: D-amino acid dehydrogenase [Natronospirillum sp.]
MHIGVVGAGVVGVTTAWVLQQRGHQVTVIEPHTQAGMETSKANAGQRSYGFVYPWASPAMIKKAVPWLLQADGPLKIPFPPSAATLRFLWLTWRYAHQSGLFEANKIAMLTLGKLSRDCFHELERHHPFDYSGGQRGLMELASSPANLQGLANNAALLARLGIEHEMLDRQAVYHHEPGLNQEDTLVGGLRLADDGTGDCQQFTQTLATKCQTAGVRFLYGHAATAVITDGGLPVGLHLASPDPSTPPECEQLEADAFVLCAGNASPDLARQLGLRLPTYPVKGYSLTAAVTHPERAPQSTILDDQYKVAMTRLGDRLRVTGFVELADFNRTLPERRLATLRRAVALRFPGAVDVSTAEAWAGFRPMTPDGPPVIGQGSSNNVFINTGHGTFGWTLSMGSAQLIGQLVDGETPVISLDRFRPDRF